MVSICLWVQRKQQRISDSLFAASRHPSCPSPSVRVCVEGCRVTVPDAISAWFHEWTKGVQQQYQSSSPHLSPQAMNASIHYSTLFYWFGSLSADLLPVDSCFAPRTGWIFRESQTGVWNLAQAVPLPQERPPRHKPFVTALSHLFLSASKEALAAFLGNKIQHWAIFLGLFPHLSLEKSLMLQCPIISCPAHHSHQKQTVLFMFLTVFFIFQSSTDLFWLQDNY